MKTLSAVIALSLMTSQAHAVRVSNLDEVTHTVVFEESQGSQHIRIVHPGETINSVAGVGWVYLQSDPSRRVRVEELDTMAIWPEDGIQIQMRRRRGTGRN